MRRYLLITCLFVLCCLKLKHVNFLKWEQENDFYYINNEKLLKRVLHNVEQTKERTKVDKPIVFGIRKGKFVTIHKETKEEKMLKDNLIEAILFDPKKDEELKIDIKETNIDKDSKKKQKRENGIIKDDTAKDKDLYSYTKDPITLHKKKLKEEKNFVMIKEFVKDLSSRDENVLISNVNIFLKRIFNLILREKIITAMCSDVQNEGIENNNTQMKGKQIKDAQMKGKQNNNTQMKGKQNNNTQMKGKQNNNTQMNDAQMNDAQMNDAQMNDAQNK
ncbi:hypothetical protein C923_00745 [Plasmodium falciparum UGT5.1]|uniref:Uncharacterized protein n=1 Tax=Plasmodium falciparum UGT5.1 TaxID=1237627 RepID=W7JTZ8_PLAFA|nr:hypothetical protein C923_00745 [Plasmodium falciparum UGT5.1]